MSSCSTGRRGSKALVSKDFGVIKEEEEVKENRDNQTDNFVAGLNRRRGRQVFSEGEKAEQLLSGKGKKRRETSRNKLS